MSENEKKKQEHKPEDVPLGTGMADKAKRLIQERKKRQREMNKRFGISSGNKPNANN